MPPKSDVETASQTSRARDNPHRRSSFFRTQSNDTDGNLPTPTNGNGVATGASGNSDWVPDRLRKFKDIVDVVEKQQDKDGGDDLKKTSSIRKRFSTLKLGTKRSNRGLMGGVEEEQQ